MRIATVDHQRDVFHVTVRDGARAVALLSGSYRQAIAFATSQGVARDRVTLTEAAQAAAIAACFGGTP